MVDKIQSFGQVSVFGQTLNVDKISISNFKEFQKNGITVTIFVFFGVKLEYSRTK